jgi:hypothetical protein
MPRASDIGPEQEGRAKNDAEGSFAVEATLPVVVVPPPSRVKHPSDAGDCPGRKSPKRVVRRPPGSYKKSTISTQFTIENAAAA